jgi:hypothetical protein
MGLGQNRDDRLADIADLVARQRIECGRVIIVHPRRRAHRTYETIEVARGVDRENPRHGGRRRGADAGDQGVGVVAAPKRHVQRAGDDAVVGEGAEAREQSGILDPPDPRADVLRPQAEADIGAVDRDGSLAIIGSLIGCHVRLPASLHPEAIPQ